MLIKLLWEKRKGSACCDFQFDAKQEQGDYDVDQYYLPLTAI